MNSRKCDVCNVGVHRASYAKHLRSKNHLENVKQNEMIIPEWLFKEPIENKIKQIYNLKPLRQIARHNIKLDEQQLNKDLAKKMINPCYFDSLQGEGVKIIIPSNIIDIYTRLEVLLGLKLSGHTDTLTEASNLIDELYKRGEIQNEQQYRNALNNFLSNKWSFQVNYQNKSHLILEVELKSIC